MTCGVALTAVSLSASSLSDLTLLQWRALRVAERSVRVTEMADALNISLPSTSKIIKRLQGRGLVDLQRDVGDQRARMVTLTPAGVEALEGVLARRREYLRSALTLSGLEHDGRFSSQLHRLAEVLSGFR